MARSRIGDSFFTHALDVLRRRKWVGLIAFCAVLSVTAPFSVFLPDIYRASATVIVEGQQAAATLVRPSVPELETRLVTIQQQILSRSRLSDLITRFNLYPKVREKAPIDALVERMRRDIHVELSGTNQGRGTPTTIGVKISYIGLDPQSAAQVPNALASYYVEENTRMRKRQTGQMAEFLKTKLDEAEQELKRQQARLDTFRERRTGELPEQVSANLMAVERLNAQLRLNADEQRRVRERNDRIVDQRSVDSPDELTSLRRKLQGLEARYTEKHPEVVQLRAQISELEQSGDSSAEISPFPRAEAPRRSDKELTMLEAEERSLRSQIASYDHRILLAPSHEQDLEALERELSIAKTTYDSRKERFEEAQLAESLEQSKHGGETFRILDAAIVPTVPAAPNRMRLLFLAVMLALGSGIGAMVLKEHLDSSFHTVGELRQFTSVLVLGSIPYLDMRSNFLSQALRVAVVAGAVFIGCALLAGFAWHTARGNTQLVWMLAGSQL